MSVLSEKFLKELNPLESLDDECKESLIQELITV